MRVINAEGCVLGRMAVEVAKLARSGEEVAVVNAERAIISGARDAVFHKYEVRRHRGCPEHGPFFPRGPAEIVRRSVRGMVQIRSPEGKQAFSRVKVYVGVPEEFKDKKLEVFGKTADKIDCEFVLIGELSKHLGYDYGK
ncbi:MAG: 50S ribosomal protein L13 [Candidatus Aenigmarchaeota archaeon]|nr:50S ribosomal protein L13 [Candidatus Aenigmarchaeota archaeon]